MRDPANSVVIQPNYQVEYASYDQYLQWIMGHAIVEWMLRGKVVWKRWAAWHRYHRHSVAILTIHYGHPEGPDYGVGYFFA